MILNEIKPNIESSGQLEEKFFSIADQGMIFEILRNKMYSNPILAICREYACNARDAHREVNISEIPIHIYLPNSLEPFYKIKDFGPGISPDRMENIFIKYTASTKRISNLQTGGFGLGCKSAFAYSDTFSIITNFNGIQYNYSCFIDETKVGKLALFSKSETKEPNGTEIIIPVKSVDFNFFKDWTEKSTRHWEVKPIIKGGIITWVIPDKKLEGNDWFIGNEKPNNSNYYSSQSCKLIIDGIEYPVEYDVLKKYADTKLIDSARGNLYLYFGVGELSLSANREQVYLDKPTQVKINNRIKDVLDYIIKSSNDKIAEFSNLWEANIFYRKALNELFHNLSFLGTLSWHGIALSSHSLKTSCNVYCFTKDNMKSKTNPNKIRRHTQQCISFDANSILFINDLSIKEPTSKHVKKAFEDNPTLTSVQVINPNNTCTINMINDDYHVDQMNAKNLSTITKDSARKQTAATSRLLVFKYDCLVGAFRQVSYSSFEEDVSKRKVLCKLSKPDFYNYKQVRLANTNVLSPTMIMSLSQKYLDVSFYGLDETISNDRIEEYFPNLISIDTFLEQEIAISSKNNYLEIKVVISSGFHIDNKAMYLKKLETLITDPQSLFLKRIKMHIKFADLKKSNIGLLYLYESINGIIEQKEIDDFILKNSDYNLPEFDKKYYKKYPLLEYVDNYNYSEMIPAVTQYINLVDAI